jgi:predicted ATPase
MKEALAQHDVLVRAAIVGQCGVIFQNAGDSFAATFVTVHAALAAALLAQRALQAAPWPEPVGALRVRMALHTGPAELRPDGWHGEHTLNRLARLLAAGHGGQVLLSGVTRDLLQEHLPLDVTLRALGARRLKDVREAVPLFQVVVPDLRTDFPPLKTLEPPPSNLPAALTKFIGREQELTAVTTLLRRESVRLVTLTGPGGTGKTRLGVQAAAALGDEFADGMWFVELASLTDPGLVVSTIATTLQVPASGEQDLLARLQAILRDKQQLLLVLDNFEHVLPAARVVEALLRAAPRLKVLATSRTILHIYGEREFLVPPLALPDRQRLPPLAQVGQYEAVRLFVERAEAVKPGFALTPENVAAVVEICWRLDGLPLALELAAARSRLFSPAALLARLEARLGLLTGGPWTLPERQQTLRGAIDWSYHLLAPGEQQLFWRLAVFRGGCSLDAAEAVCNAAGDLRIDVLTGVQSLADKSLLRLHVGRDNEPRLVMLETIQEYAREKLVESGDEAAIRQQHALCFLALAEQAAPELHGRNEAQWLDRLEGTVRLTQATSIWKL